MSPGASIGNAADGKELGGSASLLALLLASGIPEPLAQAVVSMADKSRAA
jgi:hypothetical protein